MNQSLYQTVGPTSEPVSLVEAKDHCEITQSDTTHDNKLSRLIKMAREIVESDTGYVLMTQTYTLTISEFPSEDRLQLPLRPLQSVSSITYYDQDAVQQTLDSSVYGLDLGNRELFLNYDQSWPDNNGQNNGIVITFVVGYTSRDNVPAALKAMVLCKTAEYFDDRGDWDGRKNPWSSAYERLWKSLYPTSVP